MHVRGGKEKAILSISAVVQISPQYITETKFTLWFPSSLCLSLAIEPVRPNQPSPGGVNDWKHDSLHETAVSNFAMWYSGLVCYFPQGSYMARTSRQLGLWTWEEPQLKSHSCHALRWAMDTNVCSNIITVGLGAQVFWGLALSAPAPALLHTDSQIITACKQKILLKKKRKTKWMKTKESSLCHLGPG